MQMYWHSLSLSLSFYTKEAPANWAQVNTALLHLDSMNSWEIKKYPGLNKLNKKNNNMTT